MSFCEAVDDYQHGRLTAARERLVTLDDVDAKLLFVRIQTRLGDTSDAAIAIELARELFASAVSLFQTAFKLASFYRFYSPGLALSKTQDIASKRRSGSLTIQR